MYRKSAELYDTIYLNMGKDYAAEAEKVHGFIQRYKQTSGNRLLDVACGTGLHIGYLRQNYQVQGLDLEENMLEVARQKYPEISFHQASMLDFDLGQTFDVITCLFSSIGYMKSLLRLKRAVQNIARHLEPGGVTMIEPWLSPENWDTGHPHAVYVDQPDLKIARMNIGELKGRLSAFNFHFLVATPEGVRHFTERHELGLFTHEEYMQAFQGADLETSHDPEGLDGRGLYIGRKPAETP